MGKVIKNSSGQVVLSGDKALEVTAAIDSNIVAGNIKKDVEILGVTGTYEGETSVLTALSVTPTTSSQHITPQGDGFSEVNISAVTSGIDANIVAGNIKKNITILGVTGTYEGSEGSGGGGTTSVHLESPSGSLDGYYLASDGTATQLPFDPMTLISEFVCKAGSLIYCYSAITEVANISGATIISSRSAGRPVSTYYTLLQANA